MRVTVQRRSGVCFKSLKLQFILFKWTTGHNRCLCALFRPHLTWVKTTWFSVFEWGLEQVMISSCYISEGWIIIWLQGNGRQEIKQRGLESKPWRDGVSGWVESQCWCWGSVTSWSNCIFWMSNTSFLASSSFLLATERHGIGKLDQT